MIRHSHHFVIRLAWEVLVLLYLVASPFQVPAYSQIRNETFPDGVEHWYVPEVLNGESYLTRQFRGLYGIAFSTKSTQPFGKSIAFLVGVSAYHYISPQLPSVQNDIADMRDFLLNRAGFDEVYVAKDNIVDRDLVEYYVKEVITAKMHKGDRLLFYYSGHGGDNQGKTGYMLFGNARKGQYWGPQVLAVDTLNDWSRELQIQHILFILDSCASGLAFTSKASANDSDRLLLQTLSGNGSRTVLTAGTADEATYAQRDRNTLGNSVFTKSLINAFEFRSLSNSAFITISDLFADVEKEMAKFRMDQGKSTTPRIWTLQEMDYRGTFVFLNTMAKTARLTDEQAKALGVTLVKKAQSEPFDPSPGIMEIFSAKPGSLFIDGHAMGFMLGGDTRQLLQQAAGKHRVEIKGAEADAKDVIVDSGKIAYATFGLESPIDDSGRVPVGSLVLRDTSTLTGEVSGEVYIDNYRVGRLEKDGQMTIPHLTVGMHSYRIGGTNQSESGTVQIRPDQTAYLSVVPDAPTGLTATVQ